MLAFVVLGEHPSCCADLYWLPCWAFFCTDAPSTTMTTTMMVIAITPIMMMANTAIGLMTILIGIATTTIAGMRIVITTGTGMRNA
ncbi:hypothetical protein V2S84_10280, partial [Azotobacter chroococcum]|nr:hypothetical protein [Azotobacter chroococcum]